MIKKILQGKNIPIFPLPSEKIQNYCVSFIYVVNYFQIESVLLNTSINSISSVSLLKDAIHSSVAAALNSNPIKLQETIAQVR